MFLISDVLPQSLQTKPGAVLEALMIHVMLYYYDSLFMSYEKDNIYVMFSKKKLSKVQ